MKLTTAMGNAAMHRAIESGLIADGVTAEQRKKLDAVIQAALDAHPVLGMGEVFFAGSDISQLAEVPADVADTVLSNANVKIVFRPSAN